MATRAHSTRTPLLRLASSPQPLLGAGLGRQPGPVTQAIRAMRAADIDTGFPGNQSGFDRQRVRELRRRIADRIEADIALLDALDGDSDFEPSLAAPEPYSWLNGPIWAQGATDDRENAECADCDGEPVMTIPVRIGRLA
jgi:hypothetical protein